MYFKQNGTSPEINIVFGNIDDICTETQKLYSKLVECGCVEDIGKVFINHVSVNFFIFRLCLEEIFIFLDIHI